MGRFKVTVGEEFEIKAATVYAEKAKTAADAKIMETEQRYMLALIILGFIGLFLLGAALIGLYEGNFSKLQVVYNVAAIPATAIFGFYFNKPPPSAR